MAACQLRERFCCWDAEASPTTSKSLESVAQRSTAASLAGNSENGILIDSDEYWPSSESYHGCDTDEEWAENPYQSAAEAYLLDSKPQTLAAACATYEEQRPNETAEMSTQPSFQSEHFRHRGEQPWAEAIAPPMAQWPLQLPLRTSMLQYPHAQQAHEGAQDCANTPLPPRGPRFRLRLTDSLHSHKTGAATGQVTSGQHMGYVASTVANGSPIHAGTGSPVHASSGSPVHAIGFPHNGEAAVHRQGHGGGATCDRERWQCPQTAFCSTPTSDSDIHVQHEPSELFDAAGSAFALGSSQDPTQYSRGGVPDSRRSSKASEWSRASEWSKASQGKKRPPLNTLLRHLTASNFPAASNLLSSTCGANRKYLNFLIKECIKASCPRGAMWCVDEMQKIGCAPSIITYNTVLNGCSQTGNFELAVMWWSRLPELKLIATDVSYNTMINACARAREPDFAERVLQDMMEAGCTPCKLSFTAVIVALASRGEAGRAEQWLLRMRDMGLQRDVVLYNSFLNACAKAGCLETAQRWAAKMAEDGLAPDIRTYNSLIHACAKLGNCALAADLFTEMKTVGLRPDLVTFGSLIHASAKVGSAIDAEKWMNMIDAEGLTPNDVCFNSMLHACALAGDGTRAKHWFARMKQCRCQTSTITFNAMVSAVILDGDEYGLASVFAEMIRRKIPVNTATIRTLHSAISSDSAAQKYARKKQVYTMLILTYAQSFSAHRALQPQEPKFVAAEVVKMLRTTKKQEDAKVACHLQGLLQ